MAATSIRSKQNSDLWPIIGDKSTKTYPALLFTAKTDLNRLPSCGAHYGWQSVAIPSDMVKLWILNNIYIYTDVWTARPGEQGQSHRGCRSHHDPVTAVLQQDCRWCSEMDDDQWSRHSGSRTVLRELLVYHTTQNKTLLIMPSFQQPHHSVCYVKVQWTVTGLNQS